MAPVAALSRAEIFALYEAARPRLPRPPRAGAAVPLPGLAALAERFELVLLDAFGVLNIGESAIPGAAAAVARLRAAGKRVMVVTNAASYPRSHLLARYRRMGFDLAPEEVVSSRETALAALAARPDARAGPWGLMADPRWGDEELDGLDVRFLGDDPAEHDAAAGFLLLGSGGWTEHRQTLLAASLARRPRPVVVANPDIVAPRDAGYSLEPGHFAHRLAALAGVEPEFHGKPFAGIFERALARAGIDRTRAVMVGDTLHTDILGGLAAGIATALVTETGSLHQGAVEAAIAASGIVPDFVLPRI